jgi:hypothetical protein
MKSLATFASVMAIGVVVGLLIRGFPVRQVVGGPPLTCRRRCM